MRRSAPYYSPSSLAECPSWAGWASRRDWEEAPGLVIWWRRSAKSSVSGSARQSGFWRNCAMMRSRGKKVYGSSGDMNTSTEMARWQANRTSTARTAPTPKLVKTDRNVNGKRSRRSFCDLAATRVWSYRVLGSARRLAERYRTGGAKQDRRSLAPAFTLFGSRSDSEPKWMKRIPPSAHCHE